MANVHYVFGNTTKAEVSRCFLLVFFEVLKCDELRS